MTRLEASGGAVPIDAQASLALPCFDMVAFAALCWSGLLWRRHAAYHRRLMFMASAGLTAAAFARFPPAIIPDSGWYPAVDALILAGSVCDAVLERRIHPAYWYGLPAIIVGQSLAMWAFHTQAPAWLVVARGLLR